MTGKIESEVARSLSQNAERIKARRKSPYSFEGTSMLAKEKQNYQQEQSNQIAKSIERQKHKANQEKINTNQDKKENLQRRTQSDQLANKTAKNPNMENLQRMEKAKNKVINIDQSQGSNIDYTYENPTGDKSSDSGTTYIPSRRISNGRVIEEVPNFDYKKAGSTPTSELQKIAAKQNKD